eukprot:TRINITY_DN11147_c0_g1::TRINITY_DN11147_c0_g1_i1::g.6532::m.6532 TRINITY_DN11147_c0_g1::TRINITY_DN11147_c0_g1_i1::g.6532  ORF type:complete len:316 (-),score=22.75,BTK/PF00779.14/0.083,DUF1152/PF06626.7/0.21 TRINITY_DN11147_c0_g1_i1:7-954(-)
MGQIDKRHQSGAVSQQSSHSSLNHSKPGRLATRIDYDLEERAFDDGDVKSQALQARKVVQESTRERVMGVTRWETSVTTGEPFPNPSLKTELSKNQSIRDGDYNYRAETLPKRRLPTEKSLKSGSHLSLGKTSNFELPLNPHLDDKTPWNVSTEVNQKTLTQRLQNFDETCKTNLNRRPPKNYVSPPEDVKNQMELMRKVKQAKYDYKKTYGEEMPYHLLCDMFPHLSKELPSYDKSPEALPPNGHRRRQKVYHHPGVWGPCQFDQGRSAWSCCMNSDRDSAGCNAVVTNPDAWNFSAPNSGEYEAVTIRRSSKV